MDDVEPIPDPGLDVQYAVRTKHGSFIPVRFVMVALLFLANMNIYGMRVNLSIALVAMVNDSGTDTGHQQISYCKGVQNDTHRTDTAGQFEWDSTTQGIILGAFYYGYLFTNIPGGYLSVYLSAKWTLGLSILFSAILNLLTPLAASHGYGTLIASRVLLGLIQGVFFPACYHLQGLWLPPEERSRGFSITSSGNALGSLVYLLLSGVLASSDIFGGWPAVFYFSGFGGILLCILWFPLAYDSPSVHPWISDHERNYIMNSLRWDEHKRQEIPRIPWRAILLSMPVWAILVCQTCSEFVMFLFLAEAPNYFSNIQGFDLAESGFLSGIPWLIQSLGAIVAGIFADLVTNHNVFRVVTVRKGLTALPVIVQCTLLLVTAYSGCNSRMAVSAFIAALSFGGVYTCGYYINKLDVAPNSASAISGVANIFTTVGGMIGPPLVSLITKEHGTVQEWKLLFWIICGVLFFGGVTFVLFASGDQQPWDRELSRREESPTTLEDSSTSPLLEDSE